MIKKIFRSLFLILLILGILAFILGIAIFVYATELSPDAVHLSDKNLINVRDAFNIYDDKNEIISDTNAMKSLSKTSINEIPDHVKNAFIAVEDKRFYSHHGIDFVRIIGAIKNNITSGKFKEGASTITQQLIKNTHLSGKKTIARKLNEIKLAIELEKFYSKDEIIEMYLNTIYFGNNAYGIEAAAQTYFNKNACELTVEQAAMLAGIIKAPTNYSPNNDLSKCIYRRNIVLDLMHNQNMISDESHQKAINTTIDISIIDKNRSYYKQYMHGAIQEACEILGFTEKQLIESNYRIYTFCNSELQKNANAIIKNNTIKTINANKAQMAIIIADNKTCGIQAFSGISNNNLYTLKRNIGSTAKPLSVYAPALNERFITPITMVNDTPQNFNGYSPKNYGDIYNGFVTVREAITKSMNIPAVSILDGMGAEIGYQYMLKNGFSLIENDKVLSIALGGFTYGVTLKELTQGYMTLANNGKFNNLTFIKKITDENGHNIYTYNPKPKIIFDCDAAFLMTDMLKSTAQYGTAKNALGDNSIDFAAKTGTCGEGNSINNTDAIIVGYTTENTISVWTGGNVNDPLPKNITGGTIPADIMKLVLNNVYVNHKPAKFIKPDTVLRLAIDKNILADSHEIVRAYSDEGENVTYEFFSKFNCPPEVSLKNNISFNVELYNGFPRIKIINNIYDNIELQSKFNKKITTIANLTKDSKSYIDINAKENSEIEYRIIAKENDKTVYESEFKKIKTQKINNIEKTPDSNWWKWIYEKMLMNHRNNDRQNIKIFSHHNKIC